MKIGYGVKQRPDEVLHIIIILNLTKMLEDYERIEGTGQIPSTGFEPGLTHLNESGIASRSESNALVESPKADKEAEQKESYN